MATITIFTKGKAISEPGPAAIGVQAVDAVGTVAATVQEAIGNSTTEFAEYQAVVRGLAAVQAEYGAATTDLAFTLKLESAELAAHLNHKDPITHPGLVPLFIEIHNARVSHFPNLTVMCIPPAENKAASRLVDEALDGQ